MASDKVKFFQLHRISHRMRFLIAFVLGPLHKWSPTKIRKDLEVRGFRLLPSLKAIGLFRDRYRSSHNLCDHIRKGRPKKLKACHGDALDFWIRSDREITMTGLQLKLKDSFGLRVSAEAVRLKLRKLGWQKKQTRYCQMVREGNRIKRLVYSLMCISSNENFEDCIFTDEASIEVMRSGRLRFVKRDEISVLAKVSKPKHPFKVRSDIMTHKDSETDSTKPFRLFR